MQDLCQLVFLLHWPIPRSFLGAIEPPHVRRYFLAGLFLEFILPDGVRATPRVAVSGLPSWTLSRTRSNVSESVASLQPLMDISGGMTISDYVEELSDSLEICTSHSPSPSFLCLLGKVRKASRGFSLSRDFMSHHLATTSPGRNIFERFLIISRISYDHNVAPEGRLAHQASYFSQQVQQSWGSWR